ncbi:glycogen synthase [Patescibacteria group bacterium]
MAKKSLNVAFFVSEAAPLAKAGGLADVAGSLPIALEENGVEVSLFLPKYDIIDLKNYKLEPACDKAKTSCSRELKAGDEQKEFKIWKTKLPNTKVDVYLIENEEYFDRGGIYDVDGDYFKDNAERYVFFDNACLVALKEIGLKPDVIHCQDYQTGLVPALLKHKYQKKDAEFYAGIATVFTIHNLAYHGDADPSILKFAGLAEEQDPLFGYDLQDGDIDLILEGIGSADIINTVSEKYAEEILTKEYSAGMEDILEKRKADLYGILNGLDQDKFNPETDPDIAANFTVSDLSGKAKAKAALQKANKLKVDPDVPTIGIVSRVAWQKGFDILGDIADELAKRDIQLFHLGNGEEKYEKILHEMGKKYPDKFAMNVIFDTVMAREIYAGVDMFLMPSRYEPCGLGQMIAMRYGTVPVVRKTGGLADTVKDYNEDPASGNGFVFEEYSGEAMLKAIDRSLELYKEKKTWQELVKRDMQIDFSWDARVQKYIELYEKAINKHK